MKKLISITLIAVLLVSCFTFAAGAESKVNIRIEGKESTYYSGDVPIGDNTTVLDAIKLIDDTFDSIDVTVVESQYGAYISGINGDNEAVENVTDKNDEIIATYYIGWMFAVDNQNASVGVSSYELNGGENIVLYYADMNAQVPVADFSQKGKITLKSYNWLPDWSGMEWQPAAGISVTLNGDEYVSDSAGVVNYDPDDFKCLVNVQVYDCDELGYPTVCRFPENYGFDMNSFKDAEKPVTLNYNKSLYVKGTYKISLSADEAVAYTTSNKAVATVSSGGKITAKKAGSATITAKTGNVTAKYKITVKNPKLNYASKTVKKGKSFTLKVTGAVGVVKYSTSNKAVAAVNSKGKVTAKKKGTATINVKANGLTLKCKVTVQ